MHKPARTLLALFLRLLTKLYLWLHQPLIIGVVGVVGKAPLKTVIAETLQTRGRKVRVHPKTYNTEIGLPLSILYVEPSAFTFVGWIGALAEAVGRIVSYQNQPDVIVVELGISEPQDMSVLVKIVVPKIVVVSEIVDHPQSGVSARTLADEIKELIQQVPKSGLILIDIDSPYAPTFKSTPHVAALQTYGLSDKADVSVSDVSESANGLHFKYKGAEVTMSRHGREFAAYYAAAQAVADKVVRA